MSVVRTTATCLPIQSFGVCSWLREWARWDQICLKKYSVDVPYHCLTTKLSYAGCNIFFLFPINCKFLLILAEQSEFLHWEMYTFKREAYSVLVSISSFYRPLERELSEPKITKFPVNVNKPTEELKQVSCWRLNSSCACICASIVSISQTPQIPTHLIMNCSFRLLTCTGTCLALGSC